VFQAIAYDPLTAPVRSLAEIKAMVNEMLAQNGEYTLSLHSPDRKAIGEKYE
jgi:alpha-galactosidase/6-phospho-beta-glucosidase family protein